MERGSYLLPPGFYLVNALVVGPLGPSLASVRLAPTFFALLACVGLHALLRRSLRGAPHAAALALAGTALAAWHPLTFALARHSRPDTLVVWLGVCAWAVALRVGARPVVK